MPLHRADGGSPSDEATGVPDPGTTYRAICLACGASSDACPVRAAALQWSRRHRHETSFPIDMIIESTLTLPSGTLGRFFQSA